MNTDPYDLTSSSIGDILYTCWGYDQTNIDFYQITARRGRATLELRKLQTNKTPVELDVYTVVPLPGQFANTPCFERRISRNGNAKDCYAQFLRRWDNKPKTATAYR